MMRRPVSLLLLVCALLIAPQLARAQALTFSVSEVMNLARAIKDETRRTYRLPSAYLLRMANGAQMTINAPQAFELLLRTAVAWKQLSEQLPASENAVRLPSAFSLELPDLQAPAIDARYEPPGDGLAMRVPSSDIDLCAPGWLKWCESFKKMPAQMTLGRTKEEEYRLNGAQMVTSLAILLAEATEKGTFPQEISVPLVRSPLNWANTSNPVVVQAAAPAPPKVIPATLDIFINGVNVTDRKPAMLGGAIDPPYCGGIRIVVSGSGPLGTVHLLVDNKELRSFTGAGPHRYDMSTLMLADGVHWLAARAMDEKGDLQVGSITSFSIMNGRQAGFTPAEPGELSLEAQPPAKK